MLVGGRANLIRKARRIYATGQDHSADAQSGKHKGSFTFARRIKLGFKDLEQFFDNLLISLFYLAPTSAGFRRQAYQWTACLVLVEVIA